MGMYGYLVVLVRAVTVQIARKDGVSKATLLERPITKLVLLLESEDPPSLLKGGV